MRRWLAHRRIGPRLSLGFGAALTLLVVVAIVAGLGLVDSLRTFAAYRDLARDTNTVGRLQANMLIAHDAAKDYVAEGDAAALEEARERLDATGDFLAEASSDIDHAGRADDLAALTPLFEDYTAGFDRTVELVEREAELLEALVEDGSAARDSVHRLIDRAKSEADVNLGVTAGLVTEQVMYARLQAQKFLTYQRQDEADAAVAALEQASAALETLHASLARSDGRALAATALTAVDAYAVDLDAMIDTTLTRAGVVDEVLEHVGPEMSAIMEDVKLRAQAEQHDLGPAAIARIKKVLAIAGLTALVALAVGVAAARLIAQSIRAPLAQMTDAMQSLAEGDLTTEVPCRDLVDEMGDMSKALQVFKDNAVERQRLQDEQEARVARMDASIGRFDDEVQRALRAVDEATGQLDESATTMSAAAGQASANVQAVAAAAEEMSASVAEISQQTDNSRKVASDAVRSVETASKVVHELNGTAQQITGIVDLISDIADQTNLLALNATIEAARAGDAGKGFAVVAHEVKTLAGRTGQATADIAEKIDTIRQGSDQAVQMIGQVNEVMARLDEVATAIAGAIEEQTATTTSIAQNAQEAAQGTENVVETIRGGEQGGAQDNRQSMVAASKQLGEQTELLQHRVQNFLEEIRAA
ncbi:MAG: methyl-accepting chemotaxis protein [Alphaproteobacteria bacterium]